jgi:hypothetical protein
MRLGGRKPGTLTSFVDAISEDVLLQVTTTETGDTLVSYRLYDATGACIATSQGLECFAKGCEVRDSLDELLLLVPTQQADNFEYRLYSRRGTLLTTSDGKRTQLFSGIRIESSRYPAPEKRPVAAR